MKINEALLTKILSLQSNHTSHAQVISFVDSFVKNLKKTAYIEYTEDSYGNLYIQKGKASIFPCMVAHMDTVHSFSTDKKVFKHGDILFAYSAIIKDTVGIGGDRLNCLHT